MNLANANLSTLQILRNPLFHLKKMFIMENFKHIGMQKRECYNEISLPGFYSLLPGTHLKPHFSQFERANI